MIGRHTGKWSLNPPSLSTFCFRSQDEEKKENVVPLAIGVNNVFEVGCEIHAKAIGDHNVFESKCK